MLWGVRHKLAFPDSTKQTFVSFRAAIIKIALPRNPDLPDLKPPITEDSDTSVVAIIQQCVGGSWKPSAFFPERLHPEESRHSTFGGQLISTYPAIRHLEHALKSHLFKMFTDQKPLVYALHSAYDRYSPREVRHLDSFIVQCEHTTSLRQKTAVFRYFSIHPGVICLLRRPLFSIAWQGPK